MTSNRPKRETIKKVKYAWFECLFSCRHLILCIWHIGLLSNLICRESVVPSFV
jgi:hypothetical protein